MVQWRRIQEDVLEGFRLLRGEVLAIFNRTLVVTDRAKARRALNKVETTLHERYQEVGEKIFQHLTAGAGPLTERDLLERFEEIERLQTERQRLLEEMKTAS